MKDVREALERARHRLGEQGQGTILFLDEVHRFNKAQQDALLPGVESGLITLIGATTENPFFEVNPPLLSRSTLFRLDAARPRRRPRAARAGPAGGGRRRRRPTPLEHLAGHANGDGRHVLTSLEVAVALARGPRRQTPARRSRSPTPRRRSAPRRCATGATSTTTSSPPSSRASAAPTPTPASTGWPACSRPGRTPASSPAAW